ncbi:hypothetical protein Ahy_A10g049976 [Arachis hypogaea]|uniref:ADF-H domain-containing protein n=1 Tax=Arachis hypogaea TaxID=3818 RepID=A0A445B8B9_ARAHY|nr:hypothetical protein Ahy_A10g049976 [Arachis hypogaea]
MASLSMPSVLEQNKDDNNNKNNSINNKFLLPRKPITRISGKQIEAKHCLTTKSNDSEDSLTDGSRSNLLEVNEVDHHERQGEEAQQKGLSLTDGDKLPLHFYSWMCIRISFPFDTWYKIIFGAQDKKDSQIEENKKQVIVEKLGEPAQGYKNFAACLPLNECRYAKYDFEFLTEGNVPKSRIFFIAW